MFGVEGRDDDDDSEAEGKDLELVLVSERTEASWCLGAASEGLEKGWLGTKGLEEGTGRA